VEDKIFVFLRSNRAGVVELFARSNGWNDGWIHDDAAADPFHEHLVRVLFPLVAIHSRDDFVFDMCNFQHFRAYNSTYQQVNSSYFQVGLIKLIIF